MQNCLVYTKHFWYAALSLTKDKLNQSRSKFAHFSEPYHGKKSKFRPPMPTCLGCLHSKQQQQPTFYQKKIVQKSLRKVIHEKTSVPKKFYLKDKYILKSVDFFSWCLV